MELHYGFPPRLVATLQDDYLASVLAFAFLDLPTGKAPSRATDEMCKAINEKLNAEGFSVVNVGEKCAMVSEFDTSYVPEMPLPEEGIHVTVTSKWTRAGVLHYKMVSPYVLTCDMPSDGDAPVIRPFSAENVRYTTKRAFLGTVLKFYAETFAYTIARILREKNLTVYRVKIKCEVHINKTKLRRGEETGIKCYFFRVKTMGCKHLL